MDFPRIMRAAAVAMGAATGTHAWAHDVDPQAQARLVDGTGWDYLVTGAEHMLTGYDHLLFLLGVVFFLRRFRDILAFVTAFTAAHTLVLLGATLAGISADHHLIDAVIAGSVIYKGFENLGGFERLLGFRPPPLLVMVFVFGLIHGLGLSTQLQTLTLASDPQLLSRIVWFSLGVELGQVLALSLMVPVIGAWRRTRVWIPVSRSVNTLLMVVGGLLLLYQVHGYLHSRDEQILQTSMQPHAPPGLHRHGDGPPHAH